MRDYSDMREVFQDEPVPVLLAAKKMWKDIELTPQPNGKAVMEWISEMQKCYSNGTVLFKRFKLSPHPILHWVVSRNRVYGQYNPAIDDVGFFDDFVRKANITELKLKEKDRLAVPSSTHLLPYFLDGSLAASLMGGGAYNRFRGTPQQAKELGLRVCAELFEERWDEVLIFSISGAWCNFFWDVAWDSTLLGIDKRTRDIWICCTTDTD